MSTARKWDEDTRREVVAHVVSHGSIKKASEATGVPTATIQYWRREDRDWWDRVEAEVWDSIGVRMKARYQSISDKATEQLMERLRRGDERLVGNKRVRVKVSARDLMMIAGIAHDKLASAAIRSAVDDGDPSAGSGDVSGEAMRKAMMAALEEADARQQQRVKSAVAEPGSNVAEMKSQQDDAENFQAGEG